MWWFMRIMFVTGVFARAVFVRGWSERVMIGNGDVLDSGIR